MNASPHSVLSHTSYLKSDSTNHLQVVHSGLFTGNVYPKILIDCPIATPTVMVRRKSLDANLWFGENLSIAEDIIMWARISKKKEIIGLDEPLTKVRTYQNAASQSYEKRLRASMAMANFVAQNDPNLKIIKRKLLSSQRCFQGHIFAEQKHRIQAIIQYLLAIWMWPVNKGIYYGLSALFSKKT